MKTLPETAPACNLLARYATFHDEPGYAIRTADRRVFFVDHDAQTVPLTRPTCPPWCSWAMSTRPSGSTSSMWSRVALPVWRAAACRRWRDERHPDPRS